MKIKILALALSLSFLVSSCFNDPKVVGISNLQIIEKQDSLLISQVTTEIENPNKVSITASDLEYKITIKDVEIGQGFVEKEFTLEANQVSSIDNRIELNVPKLISIIDFVFEKDSFPVDVAISLKVEPVGIKISKETQVYFKLADLMKNLSGDIVKESLNIKGLKITEIRPSYTKMNINFEFDNKFPFDYSLDSLNFDIFDNEKLETKLGSTKSSKTINIKSKETTPFSIKTQIQNISAGLSFFKKVLTQDRSFFIKGNIFIDFEGSKIKVPIQQKIEPM